MAYVQATEILAELLHHQKLQFPTCDTQSLLVQIPPMQIPLVIDIGCTRKYVWLIERLGAKVPDSSANICTWVRFPHKQI